MPVQLSDLLAPHLGGVDAAVGLDDTATAAISALGLPTGDAAGPHGPATLLVASVGPDTEGAPLAAAAPKPGARVLVLFGFPAEPVPLPLLRSLAPSARLQLLAAGAIETPEGLEDVFGAALLSCVEIFAELEARATEGDDDDPIDNMSGAAASARYERALAGRDRRIQSLRAAHLRARVLRDLRRRPHAGQRRA